MKHSGPKIPQKAPSSRFGKFVRFFLRATRPWRWVYIGKFAGVLVATAAGYVLPVVQKRLINALAGRESDGIWALFLAAGALMLLVRCETLLRQRVVNSTVQKVMFALETRIMNRLLGLPHGPGDPSHAAPARRALPGPASLLTARLIRPRVHAAGPRFAFRSAVRPGIVRF